MSQEHDGRVETTDRVAAEPRDDYDQPTLVLVGNLNDLLAGNASKFPDLGACTGAAGNVPDPPVGCD